MLPVIYKKSCEITEVKREENALFLGSERGQLRLKPQTDTIVRVTYTQQEEWEEFLGIGIEKEHEFSAWDYAVEAQEVVLRTAQLRVVVNLVTGSICYYDMNGRCLLAERERDSHELSEFDSFKSIIDENLVMEEIDTPDGKKSFIKEASQVFDRKLYHTKLHFAFQKDERIYGLGQAEEGVLNLRGTTQYLHQANLKIPMPIFLSTAGYGLLFSTGGTAIFSDTQYGSYFYTEADIAMDFYFMAGDRMDDVVKSYRFLTGKAVMLPRWAFGFVQSQERYETQQEVLAVAKEYRERGIGLDAIVMDWMSWEGEYWGQKTFDLARFPDPSAMTQSLHDMDVKFMISVWPNMYRFSDNYSEFAKHDLLLLASEIYDAFNPEGRALYWKQANEGLFQYGIDAWWCDSCEPFCPEWIGSVKPEPSAMYHDFVNTAAKFLPVQHANAYPLVHAQTMYEGQRSICAEKRVTNLTRGTYTGGQKYGIILWSGDTMASWETLQNQIVAGLNFCASGMPYWTLDIGAFFVKTADKWFRNGQYPDGLADLGYRELFVRWFQYGAFLPVFRSHGTDVRREMWLFDGEDHRFYDAMKKANQLRYRLLPYIYSLAGSVTLQDDTMMRLLAFDFPQDVIATQLKDEYMFGPSILVCPVTEPMLYTHGSKPVVNPPTHKQIYLPQGCDWYDFWTDERYAGGQWIEVTLTLEHIPLFVKAGSIVPMTTVLQSTKELDTAPVELHIYRGADAAFALYSDDADGYAYEQGAFNVQEITWNEANSVVELSKQSGYAVVYHGAY